MDKFVPQIPTPDHPHYELLSEAEWQELSDIAQLETDSNRVIMDIAKQEQSFAFSPENHIPTPCPSPSQEIPQAQVTPSKAPSPTPDQDEEEDVMEEEDDSIEVNYHDGRDDVYQGAYEAAMRKQFRKSHRLPNNLLNVRSFNWFGTHNSDEYMDKTELDEAIWYNKDLLQYLVVFREIAPTTGKVHYHSLVVLNRLSYAHAAISIDPNAHWKKVNGRITNCYEYISKGGDLWFEYGTVPHQIQNWLETKEKGTRKRTQSDIDWYNTIQLAKRGCEDIRDTKIYARFRAYFDDILAGAHKDEVYQGDLQFKNLWIYGPPGTGKSRLVWDYARDNGLTIYVKLQNKWWDGFRKHDMVLIDDAGENMKALASHIKNWADRYPFTAEVKGGSRRLNPTFNFIVTSNYAIEELFNATDAEAIKRRFDILFIE